MNKYHYSGYVRILGKRYNDPHNYLNVECSLFDCSAYVDSLRACLRSEQFQYLVIEPIKVSSDLFEQIDYADI